MKILLFLLLFSCTSKKNLVVEPIIKQKCQTLFNEKEKVEHKHCKDIFYFGCGHWDMGAFYPLNLFTKANAANKFCNTQRENKILAE